MNTKARIFIVALCLIVIAGLAYVLLKKDPVPVVTDQSATEQPVRTDDQAPVTEKSTVQKGAYIPYAVDKIASTKGTKLLFFHAPWCPQCRELDASIAATTLPDNLTIFKVDYDTNQPLRAKYGVTIQTTVVKVNDSGEKISSYVAYDKPVFASVQQALLK